MNLEVIKPGLLTTVQDLGRWGWQRYGIVVGGALDPWAARVANVLVGNTENAAVLEIAQSGPDLRFEEDVLVAWCGADYPVLVEGRPVPGDRAVRVAAGEVLSFGFVRRGLRAWLAVAGGLEVPLVLDSRSTYRRAGLGGHEGRSLAAGDRLPVGKPARWAVQLLDQLRGRDQRHVNWTVHPAGLGNPPTPPVVRAVRGPEWDWFSADAQRRFFTTEWRITKDADRMGARLAGPALDLKEPREMISSAVNAGIVQVPAGGEPIVLLASRQSVGGYPRIASVATVDLGRFAQLREGDPIRFQEISLLAAHHLHLVRERHLGMVRAGLVR